MVRPVREVSVVLSWTVKRTLATRLCRSTPSWLFRRKNNLLSHKICMWTFIMALFVMAPNWRNARILWWMHKGTVYDIHGSTNWQQKEMNHWETQQHGRFLNSSHRVRETSPCKLHTVSAHLDGFLKKVNETENRLVVSRDRKLGGAHYKGHGGLWGDRPASYLACGSGFTAGWLC